MAKSEVAVRRNRSGIKIRRKVYPYLYVLPAILVVAVFAIYPIFHAVRMSFYKYILTQPNNHPFVGLGNYIEVLTSYYFQNSIKVTAVYTIAAVAGVLLYGLGVALLLNSAIKLSGPL
ncbi:MAG: carbohydrate ABC transporter permease [Anaerolineales bacterium]